MDDDREPTAGDQPGDGRGDDAAGEHLDGEEPAFERPVDRFRSTTVGTIVAAGLLGLADALEGRPPREQVAIVQDAPMPPPQVPRRLELLLDPEHPERSMVFLPAPTPEDASPDPARPDVSDPT